MKLFVWDFHGTLEKGNELAAGEISNRALEKKGFSQRFTEEDSLRLYGKKWYEYFEFLLPEEPHETHIELQATSFDISNSSPEIIAKHIKPNDYVHDILRAIDNSVHTQIVLSNTTPESIKMFLESIKIKEFFQEDKIFAVNGHRKDTGKFKQGIIKEFLKEKKFEEIIFIGDSANDLNLVEESISYLYAHPGRNFREAKADYKIRDLRAILNEI